MASDPADVAKLDAAAKRRLLAQLLAKKSKEKQYPASFTQEALWFLNRLNPVQTAYSLFPDVRIRGPLRMDVLQQVLNEMLRRHEVLRTRFPERDGSPVQLVEPFEPREFELIDLSALSDEERRRETRRLSLEQPPIDLRKGPVVGGRIIRWGEQDHVLLLYIHHIIFDGWSFGMASREVAMLYQAFAAGQPSPLPALPMQYGEFAIWQRQYLSGERLARLERYWLDKLSGLQPLEMPTDRPRPPVRTTNSGTVAISVPPHLNRRLLDFAKQEGVTLYVVLLAAFSETLHRFTGVADIAVGSPVANRRRREFEPLIGYFINMIVMRNDLSGDPSYRQLIKRVQRTVLDGFENQDLTLDRVVKKLAPERDLSRHPVFQVMFVLQNTPPPVLEVAGLRLEAVPGATDVAESIFELTMEWMLESGRLHGRLQFNSDLFARASINRLADHYLRLMERLLDRPDEPLSTISSLGAEVAWLERMGTGAAPAEVTQERTVPALFTARAGRWPDAVAVAVEETGRALTYAQLDAWSDALALALREQGARRGVRVAVLLPRGLEAVVVLLGVLKTGAAYMPMDPGLPAERIATILDDAGPDILVTTGDRAATWSGAGLALMVVEPGGEIPAPAAVPLADTPSDGDLAYIIYTSGSTGRPKGVQIEHRALLNYALGAIETYGLTANDRVLQFGSFSYDGHVEEVYPTLLCGGTLVLRDDHMLQSLTAFSTGCAERSISVVTLPTGFWHEWTRALESGYAGLPDGLRLVIIGGEAVQPERIRGWFAQAAHKVRLINSYGPTETTVVATAVELTMDHGREYRPPIGRPLPGVRMKVVDAFGRLSPPGVDGELLIGGVGLSCGYLGRDDLTQRVYFVDPADGRRWYRTGDRVRWRDDGLLEFVGRIDEQLKIRGFRVEPAEIEAAIIEHPLVERAGVFPFDTDAGPRLAAYLGVGDSRPDTTELRTFLRRRLPDYMVPSRFVAMPALPLNSSGKVARERLPAPGTHPHGETGLDAPVSENEGRMIQLWQQILDVEPIGRDDDFFALGGDSLSALRLVEMVRQAFGVDVGLALLFAGPSPALLAEHVEGLLAVGSLPEAAPIAKAEPTDGYPLSLEQEHFYFLSQLNPGSAAYNLHTRLHLQGPLDLEALRFTLREILRRHEILRTRFEDREGRPRQVIETTMDVDWQLHDLTESEPAARDEAVGRFAQLEATTGFDLSARPPLRVRLLRLGEEEHLLLLTAHHILLDAWSLPILIREVVLFYSAFSRSQPLAIRKPAIQFGDFASWQREHMAGDHVRKLVEHWRQRLAGIKILALPTDRPRPAEPLQDSRSYRFTLDPRLAARVRAAAKRSRTTVFEYLLTAFKLLLHRYSGETDIAVGVPISGRGRKEIAETVGCFVNTLVMRSDFSDNPRLEEVLERVKATTREAFAHQELPLHLLVQELRPEREAGRNPLFQALFNFHQEPLETPPAADGALTIRPEETEQPHSGELDLVLTVQAGESEMTASLGYSGELFDDATIARMADHWQLLLERLEADPGLAIGAFPLLREAEEAVLLNDWCGPAMDLPSQMVPQLFDLACERYPDAPAVIHGGAVVSYRQMGERVAALARRLAQSGLQREEMVAVALSPAVDLPVAMLAIMRAGGAMLPMDPHSPAERQGQILAEAGVRIGFADGQAVEHLAAAGVRVLSTDDGEAGATPAAVPAPGDLAYCIFTSGSTGRPKGVLVEHGSLLNAVWSFIRSYALGPGDRLLHQTSLSFDVAINEILPPLCAGAAIVMPEDMERWDLPELVNLVERQQVSILAGVPALLAHLDAHAHRLPSLRLVLSGGDSLAYETVPRLRRQATVTNGYGPTEATICASYHDLSDAPEAAGGRVSIGRPLPNYRIYILDRYGRLAPIGVPGELCIAGPGVARGYLARPQEEASRFVADPFQPGRRMYRTGDLACWRADGRLDFLGRIDRQIKVRGVRIEPAEIEAAILAHPAVRQASVLLGTGGRLTVFAGLDAAARSEWESSAALIGDLRSHLRRRLPAQYQPSDFELLDALPLTLNGKVDTDALVDCVSLAWGDLSRRLPQNPTEERIAQIWSECLDVSDVGRDDDFFSLGGHSLLAVETVARINARLEVDLPVAALFEQPRLCDLAAMVASTRQPMVEGKRLWPLNQGGHEAGDGTPFFCLHGLGGLVTGFWGLGRQLEPRPVFGVSAAGLYGDGPPDDSIERMAAASLSAIREAQPHGPYLLGGWSMGGWIATEIARSLRAAGEQVALLVLLDAPLPAQDKSGVLQLDWLGGRIDGALARSWGGWNRGRIGRLLRQYGVTGRVDEAFAVRLQAVIEAHRKALKAYRPQPYDGPALYWQAGGGGLQSDWQRLFPRLNVEGGHGDHFSMLREPAVADLGAVLREYLNEVDNV